MSRSFTAILSGLLLLVPLLDAQAQTNNCVDSVIPPELAGWTTQRPLAAARNASELPQAAIGIGSAAQAALTSTGEVRYVLRPEKPGGSVSFGGLFSFVVAQPGTYRVALGSSAWVDVLRGTKAVTSLAHGHGPECSGILKMVDFPLTPGRYTLQIAANGEPSLPLMIVRLP